MIANKLFKIPILYYKFIMTFVCQLSQRMHFICRTAKICPLPLLEPMVDRSSEYIRIETNFPHDALSSALAGNSKHRL